VELHNDDALRMNGSNIQFCENTLCFLRKSYFEIEFTGVKVDKEGEKEKNIVFPFLSISSVKKIVRDPLF
jgi:hypothetical protein